MNSSDIEIRIRNMDHTLENLRSSIESLRRVNVSLYPGHGDFFRFRLKEKISEREIQVSWNDSSSFSCCFLLCLHKYISVKVFFFRSWNKRRITSPIVCSKWSAVKCRDGKQKLLSDRSGCGCLRGEKASRPRFWHWGIHLSRNLFRPLPQECGWLLRLTSLPIRTGTVDVAVWRRSSMTSTNVSSW